MNPANHTACFFSVEERRDILRLIAMENASRNLHGIKLTDAQHKLQCGILEALDTIKCDCCHEAALNEDAVTSHDSFSDEHFWFCPRCSERI
jgi:hypothetical protein